MLELTQTTQTFNMTSTTDKKTTASKTKTEAPLTNERAVQYGLIMALFDLTSIPNGKILAAANIERSNFYRFKTTGVSGVSGSKCIAALDNLGWANNALRTEILHSWTVTKDLVAFEHVMAAIPRPTTIVLYPVAQKPTSENFICAYIRLLYEENDTEVRLLVSGKTNQKSNTWPALLKSEQFTATCEKLLKSLYAKKKSRQSVAPIFLSGNAPLEISSQVRKVFFNQGNVRRSLVRVEQFDPQCVKRNNSSNDEAAMRDIGIELLGRLQQFVDLESQRTGKPVWRKDAGLIERATDILIE